MRESEAGQGLCQCDVLQVSKLGTLRRPNDADLVPPPSFKILTCFVVPVTLAKVCPSVSAENPKPEAQKVGV